MTAMPWPTGSAFRQGWVRHVRCDSAKSNFRIELIPRLVIPLIHLLKARAKSLSFGGKHPHVPYGAEPPFSQARTVHTSRSVRA